MMAVKATSLDDLSHGVSATREEGGHLKNESLDPPVLGKEVHHLWRR